VATFLRHTSRDQLYRAALGGPRPRRGSAPLARKRGGAHDHGPNRCGLRLHAPCSPRSRTPAGALESPTTSHLVGCDVSRTGRFFQHPGRLLNLSRQAGGDPDSAAKLESSTRCLDRFHHPRPALRQGMRRGDACALASRSTFNCGQGGPTALPRQKELQIQALHSLLAFHTPRKRLSARPPSFVLDMASAASLDQLEKLARPPSAPSMPESMRVTAEALGSCGACRWSAANTFPLEGG